MKRKTENEKIEFKLHKSKQSISHEETKEDLEDSQKTVNMLS